jgi:hypothetical protein
LAIVLSVFWPLCCLSFGHCVVCPLIYGLCSSLWYLQPLLLSTYVCVEFLFNNLIYYNFTAFVCVDIVFIVNSNMTSFFRFANKRASYPFGIISLAHAPVNVTDFSIGIINCVRHLLQM